MGPPIELRDRNLDAKAANSSQSHVNDEQGLGRVGKKQILKVRDDPEFVFPQRLTSAYSVGLGSCLYWVLVVQFWHPGRAFCRACFPADEMMVDVFVVNGCLGLSRYRLKSMYRLYTKENLDLTVSIVEVRLEQSTVSWSSGWVPFRRFSLCLNLFRCKSNGLLSGHLNLICYYVKGPYFRRTISLGIDDVPAVVPKVPQLSHRSVY